MINALVLPMTIPASRGLSKVRWGLLAVAALLIVLLGGAACGGSQDWDNGTAFSLTSSQGQNVSLSELVQEHDRVVVVFYRGYF